MAGEAGAGLSHSVISGGLPDLGWRMTRQLAAMARRNPAERARQFVQNAEDDFHMVCIRGNRGIVPDSGWGDAVRRLSALRVLPGDFQFILALAGPCNDRAPLPNRKPPGEHS